MENQRTTPQADWSAVEVAAAQMLVAMGCDLNEPGLRRTPERIALAWKEMLAGYQEDPEQILKTDFPSEGYDQMIVLEPIEFYSVCEHHLLPFIGTAAVGYISDNGKVVGVSKLARLVDCFARRLQIQERMTKQIADAIQNHLEPKGVAVYIRARHLCMECRGARKREPWLKTSALRGVMRENPAARAEFFEMVKK
jgi:GTP cyclohydrolase I